MCKEYVLCFQKRKSYIIHEPSFNTKNRQYLQIKNSWVFTYKLINKINNVPIIFINTISTASSQHSYSTRFAKNQNFRRSKAQTNYGIFTFRFASSKICETIPNYIKQSNSISVFKKRYTQFLLSSRSGLFQIRQSTSCPQANCVLTSNNYFNGFFRFKYFLNVFKDE